MEKQMVTEAQARKVGWQLARGSYSGTTDNRLDRWYWERIDSDVVDRTGSGYATKRDALTAMTAQRDEYDAWLVGCDCH